MPPLLQIADLHSGYKQMDVLHGIDLYVMSGEIVSLIGANGAGKSTLLNTILGIVQTRAGRMSFDGEIISGRMTPDIVRRGIAVVPERRQLFDAMTVEDNLRVGAYARADRPNAAMLTRDVNELFQLFPRLKERRHQITRSMSGGEQQMVAIARALMAKPRLLLLDEPSLGLAPLIVEQIMQQLTDLRSKGCTIMLIEQNARVALSISDRCYIVETGKISASGMASDLLRDDRVQNAYLGGHADSVSSMEARIRARAAVDLANLHR